MLGVFGAIVEPPLFGSVVEPLPVLPVFPVSGLLGVVGSDGLVGVTGFVGSGTDPIPLTEDEIRKMGFEISEINVDYDVNDSIEIIDGPFKDYVGVVQEINKEKHKVKVLISMFGRETPVDLELSQVQKVK